jgi:16S rRNA processing protein RimM
VSLGRVSGAHGIRGALKVRADAEAATTDPEVFSALGEVWLDGQSYQVIEARPFKTQVMLKLAGVETRNQAEGLVGLTVEGERGSFPPLAEGEYYWFQVLGLAVVNVKDGTRLGYLAEIIPTPAHDVYVVRQGKREVLLPAVEDVIVEINLAEGVIKAAPEGFL